MVDLLSELADFRKLLGEPNRRESLFWEMKSFSPCIGEFDVEVDYLINASAPSEFKFPS